MALFSVFMTATYHLGRRPQHPVPDLHLFLARIVNMCRGVGWGFKLLPGKKERIRRSPIEKMFLSFVESMFAKVVLILIL